MKVIKLTESELVEIVKKVISEQDPMRSAAKTNTEVAKIKISQKYPCVPSNVTSFVDYVMNNKSLLMKTLGIDLPTLLLMTKASLGILGRETKFGEYTETSDAFSEILRSGGLGSVVDWGLNKLYPGKTQSLGLGQFTPDTWKEYGLDKTIGDYNKSFDEISQGLGVLYTLNTRYKKALENGLTTQPSENPTLSKYGVINKINGTGNHALDMAILSHNMPRDKTLFKYCKTNHPLYATPCWKTVYSPYDNKESFNPNTPLLQKVTDPKLKQFPGQLTVNKNEVIPNFFPNLKGPQHSAIGYVEEVAKYIRSFSCF